VELMRVLRARRHAGVAWAQFCCNDAAAVEAAIFELTTMTPGGRGLGRARG
jgi:hypothetical protein